MMYGLKESDSGIAASKPANNGLLSPAGRPAIRVLTGRDAGPRRFGLLPSLPNRPRSLRGPGSRPGATTREARAGCAGSPRHC